MSDDADVVWRAYRRCRPPYLVGPKWSVPEDPSDYRAGWWDPTGCNRIACEHCKASVQVDSDRVAERRGKRGYRCRCAEIEVEGDDVAELDLRKTAWNCASHPFPAFPFMVDGFQIGEGTDLYGVIRDVLLGALPETARIFRWVRHERRRSIQKKRALRAPSFWVASLANRVGHTWAEKAIGDALYRCLVESTSLDPEALLLRARALACYPTSTWDEYGPAPGWERLADVLRCNQAGFPYIKDPVRPGTLMGNLMGAIDYVHRWMDSDSDD